MIAADTITDEQIRELERDLKREHPGRRGHARIREMLVHISDALRTDEVARYRGARHNARAYCAGILSARKESK